MQGGNCCLTRKRKILHLSLFFLWMEASHNKAQHEGVWVIKQAKQLKGTEFTLTDSRNKTEASS